MKYFNDSKCTTPGGTIVAVEAFEPGKSIVIVGGYDKGVGFDEMGKALAARAKAVIAIGATGEKILSAVRTNVVASSDSANHGTRPIEKSAGDLASAVEMARELAEPGDSGLLSPACASYDKFTHYADL